MLPLSLLNAAQGQPMLVELKNGETYNGHLLQTDNWMNMSLKQVIHTSATGDVFKKIPEIYIRGNSIKYIRVAEECILKVRDDQYAARKAHEKSRGGLNEKSGRGRKKY